MTRNLIVGVDRMPSNLDMEQPEGFGSWLSSDLYRSFYEQLTSPRPYVGESGTRRIDWHNLRADLAEAWWFSDDHRTCTFRIRRGVRSAAGHELTAENVKWGWDRAFALRDVGKWVARVSSVQEAGDVEVVDRYTLAFHLAAPNPALPRTMSQCTPSVYDTETIGAASDSNDPWAKKLLARNPAGFGPYSLDSMDDNETVLRANEYYRLGKPSIDEVRVRRFPGRAAILEALKTGEIQFMLGATLDEVVELRKDTDLRVTSAFPTPGTLLQLDPTEPPFDDPLVRRAVAAAIPYQEIIQTAYGGAARRWRSYVQPEAPGYSPDHLTFEENLPRSRDLLAQSSRPDGFTTRLSVLAGDGSVRTAEIIAASLARVGIDVTVEPDTSVGRRLVELPKANLAPMMLRVQAATGRGNRVFEPLYALNHDFARGRMRLTKFAYENERLYEETNAIAVAGHGDPWEKAVREAQRILNEDAVAIPICQQRFFVAHHRDLEGYRWYPDNCLSFVDLRWKD